MTHDHPPGTPSAHPRRLNWTLAGLALIALLLIAIDHRAHLLGSLPYLLLLACPLLHLLLHGGHRHRGGPD